MKIGIPYRKSPHFWACPCEIEGHEPRYPDICGDTSVQALSLALALPRLRLEDFLSKGGKIYYPGYRDRSITVREIALSFGLSPKIAPGVPRNQK